MTPFIDTPASNDLDASLESKIIKKKEILNTTPQISEEESTDIHFTVEKIAVENLSKPYPQHASKFTKEHEAGRNNLQDAIANPIKAHNDQTKHFLMNIGDNVKYDEKAYNSLIKTLKKETKSEFRKSITPGAYSKNEKDLIITNAVNQRLSVLLNGIVFHDFQDETSQIGKILIQIKQLCFETAHDNSMKLKMQNFQIDGIEINSKKYQINISNDTHSIILTPLMQETFKIISANFSNTGKKDYCLETAFNTALKDALLNAMFEEQNLKAQEDVRKRVSRNLSTAIETTFSNLTSGADRLGFVATKAEPFQTTLEAIAENIESVHRAAGHAHTVERHLERGGDVADVADGVGTLKNAMGGAALAIGAVQTADGLMDVTKGIHRYNEAKIFLETYGDFKNKIALGDEVDVDALDIRTLDEIERKIRIKLLLDLSGGSSKTISGAVNILSGCAIIAGATTIAAAGTGTSGGLLIVGGVTHGIYHGYKLVKIDQRISQANNIKIRLAKENIRANDAEIAKKFVDLEINLLKNKKFRSRVSLTGDAMIIVGGSILIAAAVSGAASCGIAGGVLLGATAVGIVGFEGYRYWKKYKFEKLQNELKMEDARNFTEAMKKRKQVDQDFTEMKSICGIVIELSRRIKKEQAARELDHAAPTPLSTHIVVEYMKITPEAFLKMMEGTLDLFLREETTATAQDGSARIGQGSSATIIMHSKDL